MCKGIWNCLLEAQTLLVLAGAKKEQKNFSSASKQKVNAKVGSRDSLCALSPTPALLLIFFFYVTLGKLLNPFNSVLGSAFQKEVPIFPLHLSR